MLEPVNGTATENPEFSLEVFMTSKHIAVWLYVLNPFQFAGVGMSWQIGKRPFRS